MDVNQIVSILNIVRIIVLGFVSIGSCLYGIPLCLIRRFHTPVNLLTLNVCIGTCVCSIFWIVFYIMDAYYAPIFYTAQSCLLILYLKNMVICQAVYSVCMVSLNRLFSIVYKNKALFRTKRWVAICISAQWILAAIIALPALAINVDSCLTLNLGLNYLVYLLIDGIIIPGISLAIMNTIIFIYVHRSTRRVQPVNGERARARTIGHRDARLLKHMIFMFAVFVCGWTPIYITMIVNWNNVFVSPIVLQVFFTLPVVSLFIDVADLFLYNHELRKYFIIKWQMDQNIPTRQ